ncbi:hypothetical protein [Sphingobium bisphenolivorans]|uniref:hypothetical protein n=1 Tax=Sphingobium bisphenolivorans TaxID=1335760 RepID=UPI00039C717A|nr:hypothetical protein [Sphingobium bisphenolivorans]
MSQGMQTFQWDRSPPDVLARLARLVFEARDSATISLIEAAIEELNSSVATAPDEEFSLSGKAICSDVIINLGGKVPEKLPRDVREMIDLVQQIQRLDRWHSPIIPSNAALMRRLDDHHLAFDRLFEDDPRLNEDRTQGLLILGQAWGRPLTPTGEELLPPGEQMGIIARLLDVTAYLPPQLTVVDPDDDSTSARQYPINVAYQIVRANNPSLVPGNTLMVAIAPMIEAPGDVHMSVSGNRYSFLPAYPPQRLDEAVALAVDRNAHVLLMPEMTVDEANLDRLSRSIDDARAEYVLTHNRAPALRFVMAGVTAAPGITGQASNYIIILDINGDVVLRQDKLRHWNLGRGALSRFDIEARCPASSGHALLYEDTPPGRTITVTDLDGIGRLFALICADMNQDQPGHWLLENVQIDWLYSPIMDGSTCWTQTGTPPWIIDRSARAAKTGASRVMVTNSMAMTHWNNEVIDRERSSDAAYPYVRYSTCGIGLFLDGSSGTLLKQHIAVPLDHSDTPVLEVRDWLRNWTAYDGAAV